MKPCPMIRNRAMQMLQRAVRDGWLVRPDACSKCGGPPTGKTKIEGHHDDYNEPLKVRWLCRRCHFAHHVAHGDFMHAQHSASEVTAPQVGQ